MSLIFCPECGHEISNNAVACPQCGRPINIQPVVERKVVVTQAPAQRRDSFPSWAFIPIGLLSVILIAIMFYVFSRPDDSANSNLKVTVNGRAVNATRTSSETVSVPQDIRTAPSDVHSTTVPGTSTAPVSAPPSTKGSVAINASFSTTTGTPRAAKSVKFYLLDKDLETILSEARIEPIEGNTLSGSLGLAMVYPDRFGDFRSAAMRAIAAHTKYAGTTDGSGIANLASVDPKDYYLFSVARVGHGFALWNSPVSVTVGENVLNLTPQDVTVIPDANG